MCILSPRRGRDREAVRFRADADGVEGGDAAIPDPVVDRALPALDVVDLLVEVLRGVERLAHELDLGSHQVDALALLEAARPELV
jgi:hypothetical protein